MKNESWNRIWTEIRAELLRQPRCPNHPEFPCVRTLRNNSINDILRVEETGVRVRSHLTANEDVIPLASFRAWWVHLQQHGTAALDPNDPNCPRSDRARLVGAILARCLPSRIGIENGGNQLRLLPSLPWDYLLPEEVPADTPLIEGAVRTVVIDAYERNPEARRQCIARHGARCCICGFDFGATYGPLADGFIHVHHLHPISEMGGDYEVDPAADLRPVCPNCHAVIHLGGACRSIEEVRQLLSRDRA